MLTIEVRDGNGITIGDKIAVRIRHAHKGRGRYMVTIEAPAVMRITRVSDQELDDRWTRRSKRGCRR